MDEVENTVTIGNKINFIELKNLIINDLKKNILILDSVSNFPIEKFTVGLGLFDYKVYDIEM